VKIVEETDEVERTDIAESLVTDPTIPEIHPPAVFPVCSPHDDSPFHVEGLKLHKQRTEKIKRC